MENKKEFKLIDSEYLPTDAENLLVRLINGKIGFHNLQMMRSFEYADGNSEDSRQGLTGMKNTKDEISVLLNEANTKGLKVQLKGNIEICVLG